MKYVLIFVMWSAAQGNAPATAEFNSFDTCDAARKLLTAQFDKKGDLKFAVCLNKGTEPSGSTWIRRYN